MKNLNNTKLNLFEKFYFILLCNYILYKINKHKKKKKNIGLCYIIQNRPLIFAAIHIDKFSNIMINYVLQVTKNTLKDLDKKYYWWYDKKWNINSTLWYQPRIIFINKLKKHIKQL